MGSNCKILTILKGDNDKVYSGRSSNLEKGGGGPIDEKQNVQNSLFVS